MMIDNFNPAPFWFLNHQLEKPEILRQLALIQECGVSGFFIHPRAGLLTPYGSDRWFELVRFIVEAAAKLNLKAWLYDEDPFPSGAAGGRILIDNPEFTARQLIITTVKPDDNGLFIADLGVHRLISAVAVKRSIDGAILEERDVSGAVGMLRPNWFGSSWNSSYYRGMIDDLEFPHCRAETFNPQLRLETSLPEGDWIIYCTVAAIIENNGKYGLAPDNLNPDCVRCFIELTHEKYAESVGDYFGTTIPGIFTDEPSTGASPPWTPALPEAFFNDHGYQLADKLYHLDADFGETSRQLREHYWRTVSRLYKENFFEQIAAWCSKHNLILCGHVVAEENVLGQTVSGGSAFGYQDCFDISGFDHITPNIGNHQYPALNFGGRFIASAARFNSHKMVLSECFGCNAFNFGFDGMRKVADWLFSLGINFLVPHGFYYSYDGWRKNDAGKSFFFQDPEFAKFKEFADYAGNMCKRLTEGEIVADICLLNPARQLRQLLPYETALATVLQDKLYQANQFLLENQYRFIIIDDDFLLANPAIVKDFKAVVVPQGYSIELPFSTVQADLVALQATEASALAICSIAPGAQTNDLLSLVRAHDNSQSIYIYNNSPQAGYFKCEPACLLYDGLGDRSYKLSDGKFAIPGYTGVLLQTVMPNEALPSYELPDNLPNAKFEFELAPEWDYQPPCNVIHQFSEWDIRVGDQQFSEHKFCLLRMLFGTELPHIVKHQVRPIFDNAPLITSIYPLPLKFSAEFFMETVPGKISLVMESATIQGDCMIILNGETLAKADFRRRFFYDSFNLALEVSDKLIAGSNRLELIWQQAEEFNGLTSALYLI